MAKGKFKRRQRGTQFGKRKLADTNRAVCDDMQPQPGCSYFKDDSGDDSTGSRQEENTSTTCQQRQYNLRPRACKDLENSNVHGNRIINMDMLLQMMNSVATDHVVKSKQCTHMKLMLADEKKMGLGSKLKFSCGNCQFVSAWADTYITCVGGQGAAVNTCFASALLDQPIGITKASLLLTSLDIPPPSKSLMQKLLDKVSDKVQAINNADMAEKRQKVVEYNRQRGAVNPCEINVSFDGRYNATRMASSYKPGQAASQAYGVAIENSTEYKYIIGLAMENKLCWTGAYLRNRGYQVECPDGHAGCTATTGYFQPHSERKMAREIAECLSLEDIFVRTLTTDGDAKAYLGMQEFYKELGKTWTVCKQSDPVHLGKGQLKKARNANFSQNMFPGLTTRKAKKDAQIALAKDIRARSTSIIDKLRDLSAGDLKKSLNRLPAVRSATIECYAGNCSFCPHDSLVCSGIGGDGDWWYKSQYLPTKDVHRLEMTEDDKALMHTILEVRLSEQAVMSVSSNTSTQKCEAFNRGTLSTMPKEINRSRNFGGYLASKTLQLNNSLSATVQKKTECLTGRTLSPKTSTYLDTMSRHQLKHRDYQKTKEFKTNRHTKRARLENRFHRERFKEGCYIADEYTPKN